MRQHLSDPSAAAAALACCLALLALPTAAQTSVSVQVGDPRFYGRIDIGGAPPPQLLYAEPVLIRPAPQRAAPVYLRVPPGHAKNWAKHCARYRACGRPAYFVQDSWYQEVYAPVWRERQGVRMQAVSPPDGYGSQHAGGKHGGKGHGKDKDKEKGKGKHKD